MGEYQRLKHSFPPVFNRDSKVLILGSFPSVKSREEGFFYGHPRNRFWKVIAEVYEEAQPMTISEKKQLLLRNQIALWDVIDECDIIGSSDSSIQNVIPTNVNELLKETKITKIVANGKTAAKLYRKFTMPITGMEIVEMPSTSPANAAYSLERLLEEWKRIKEK